MLTMVTSPIDVLDPNDGFTTLREAVMSTPSGGAVSFALSLNGQTITLSRALGEIGIDRTMTIDGGSQNITIQGEDLTPGSHNDGFGTRLFNIIDPSDGVSPPNVTIMGLTLTNADPALNDGNGSTISPQGGAIRSAGILKLTNVTIKQNGADFGAGVYVAVAQGGATQRTVLTIDSCHIDDNSTFVDGGAVYVNLNPASGVGDKVVIVGSTLSHNNAGVHGGFGRGGALYVGEGFGISSTSSVTVSASTF
jgi:hypothetical protein